MSRLKIEKLSRKHELAAFDCGSEALNRFLTRFALQNQQSNSAQTYLGLDDDTVIGSYTLVVGEVASEGAPMRLAKGLARYPIPIMLLARMAVAVGWQGRGVGAGLLKDAMLRTAAAADIAGIRAFLVHAKDENARRFYEHLGFEAFVDQPLTLYRLIKDIQATVEAP